MNHTFRGFMSRIIDYAGLFPPAAEDMGAAIRAFARHRAGRDAWMLGRFVVPAARLAELAPHHDEVFDVGEPLRFSILAGFGETEEEALAALEADVRSASAFHERHKGRASIESIETKLPEELAEDRNPNRIAAYARRFGGALAGAGGGALEAWIEAPGPARWVATANTTIGAIGRVTAEGLPAPLRRLGFKVRCGGPDASFFPGTAMAAFAIAAGRDARVPLKWTAGLHHPVRRLDPNAGVLAHGFLNVFGAAILARAGGWPPEKIEACLADEDAAHFAFGDDAFSWNDASVPAAEVIRAREEFATGFGSCSFDEPREDLAGLGWMDPIADGE